MKAGWAMNGRLAGGVTLDDPGVRLREARNNDGTSR